MELQKEKYINELWRQFINRIKSDWKRKYSSYGKNIDTIDSPTKFAQAVNSDMISYFNEKGINLKVVNYLTLHSYFLQGGFSKNVKAGTLDVFCRYLGYERLRDFKEKNKKLLSSQKKKVVATAEDLILLKKQKRNSKRVILILSFLLISSLTYSLFIQKSATKLKGEKRSLLLNIDTLENELDILNDKMEIEKTIREASRLEFEIYKAFPNIKDTIKLKTLFTANGEARKVIFRLLNKVKKNNRKLRIPVSHYEIFNVNVTDLTESEAFVRTLEEINFTWYNTDTNIDEIIYNHTEQHRYILKKIDGVWKVHFNKFEGKAESL